MSLKIKALIEPVPFKRVSAGEGRRFNPRRYRAFKEELGWQARLVIKEPFKSAVSIRLKVYRQMPPESLRFGDVDNHLKAVLDSLNGIAYLDDRQVVVAQVSLHRGEPRLEIELEELR